MRSEGPALLPIFRSRYQADVLCLLMLHPEREYTLTELARQVGVPLSTLHAEAKRLIESDLLVVRSVGKARLVRANTSNRIVPTLTQLLLATFGPHVVVGDEFGSLAGTERLVIYGSWAARYEGRPGPPPHDVDVLVIGSADRDEVYEAADRAEQRLALPVNPVLCSVRRWEEQSDALIQEIRSAPIVEVLPQERGESGLTEAG